METNALRCSGRMRWAALVALLVIALAPAASLAAENNAESMAKEIGIGTASALSTLIYGPLKIAYATGGVVVGALGWIFSGGDADVAKTVMTPAVYGDYVILPDIVTGERALEFYGRSPEYATNLGDLAAEPPIDW